MPITAGYPKDEPDVQIIENYKEIVQLNGFVNPQQAFIRAVELVRTVKEVKSVKNDIIVK